MTALSSRGVRALVVELLKNTLFCGFPKFAYLYLYKYLASFQVGSAKHLRLNLPYESKRKLEQRFRKIKRGVKIPFLFLINKIDI